MRSHLLAITLVAACTVNGKPFGFGGPSGGPLTTGAAPDGAAASASDPATSSSGTSGGAAPSAGPTAPPGPTCRVPPEGRLKETPPALDRPVDPWLAVADGRPVIISERAALAVAEDAGVTCDAAHDHCLRDCVWFTPSSPSSSAAMVVVPVGGDRWMDNGGLLYDDGPGEEIAVAYRTVPATRDNLQIGVTAVAAGAGLRTASLVDGRIGFWQIGEVAAVDWDRGTVTLRGPGNGAPYFISATRVAVLAYRHGQPVSALPGVPARAPTVAEVILPAARVAAVADPWAAVDRQGQPRVVATDVALTTYPQDCAAAYDHCLRPTTWLVDAADGVRAARWDGQAWIDPLGGRPLDLPRKAYRSRPARAGELTVGTTIIAFHGVKPPHDEADAHAAGAWVMGPIVRIDGELIYVDASTYTVAGNARIPVLWWMPGERAEAL